MGRLSTTECTYLPTYLSSDDGSVGADVQPDEFMGRYGLLRDEEGLETV